MGIWMYISVIAFGPIKECRKLIDALLLRPTDYGLHTPDNIFVNFNVKNREDISGNNVSVKEEEKNLQQICAGKVLSLYEENKIDLEAIANLPLDLLQKIASSIDLLVPTTEEDVFFDELGNRLVRPPVKLNFNNQDQFIKCINELRPDLPSNWADDGNNKQGIVVYNQHRRARPYELKQLIDLCSKIDLKIVGRTSCDYDDEYDNCYSIAFVIEDRRVAFMRSDLPMTIDDDDHALMKKYGNLLQDWMEISTEKRLEFDTHQFGQFKLIRSSKQMARE